MAPVFRITLSVLLGIILASMCMGLVDALNAYLYPSTILHPSIEEQANMIRNSPLSELVLILTGSFISAFFGAYAAARVAPAGKKMVCGVFIGFFLLLCAIFYFILIPHPLWFALGSGLLFLVGAFAGANIASK